MKKKSLNIFRRWFKPKFKSLLIDEKFRIEEAFTYDGVKYYHFADQFQAPSGREMMALAFYDELQMRCDRDYLLKFCEGMNKVLNNPKSISIKHIALMVTHLEERLRLLPMPDYIYRLGSVMFFDESESIYSYDYDYNQKKIEKWKQGGEVLDFFLQTPLSDMILSLGFAGQNLSTYFPVMEKVDQIHRELLSEVLSAKS